MRIRVHLPKILFLTALIGMTVMVIPALAQDGGADVGILQHDGWVIAEFTRTDANCNEFVVVAAGPAGFIEAGNAPPNTANIIFLLISGNCTEPHISFYGNLHDVAASDFHVTPGSRSASVDKIVTYTDRSCNCPITIDIDLEWSAVGRATRTNQNDQYVDPSTGSIYIFHRHTSETQAQVTGSVTVNGVTLADGDDLTRGLMSSGSIQQVSH